MRCLFGHATRCYDFSRTALLVESVPNAWSYSMKRLVRETILNLHPYEPVMSAESLSHRLGMPMDMIVKLDSNENPYGPSILVQEALATNDLFHRYPDSMAEQVRERLAMYAGSSAKRIVIGAGSDELIDLILMMTIDPGDSVIIPVPTFGVYHTRTTIFGGEPVQIPRNGDFGLDMDRIIQSIDARTKAIFICSPNNPSGNPATNQEVVRLLETGILVVVDEAYFEFSGKTVLPLTREFDNLIVLRTFSKWAGIAGLRFGYAILPELLVDQLWKVKPPFNVSSAAMVAAEASLDDLEYLHMSINRIRNEQRRLHRRLEQLDYLSTYPSVANFILAKVIRGDAQDIFQRLADRGIMIRNFGPGPMQQYLRFSVGRPEDTTRLIEALETIGSRV